MLDRENLIEEMIEAYFGYNKTGCKTDMGDVLVVVEKALAEKHATISIASGYSEGLDIAQRILASVGIELTEDMIKRMREG